MNPELQRALGECVQTSERLISMLDEDRERFPKCIQGEFLPVYLHGLERARDMTTQTRNQLSVLLARESVGP